MRNNKPSYAAFGRILQMLEAIIDDGGRTGIATLASEMNVPLATAYRQVFTLLHESYLVRAGRGKFVAGQRLLRLANKIDERQTLIQMASPLLALLAVKVRCIVQLGTLDNDMVTYRIKVGSGASDLFTRVGMQLEAYCSGIGKVLLAHLPEDEQEAYLAAGPFVALTENTITDADVLRRQFRLIRDCGYARDDGEIAPDLSCIAVPIFQANGRVLAALSLSQASSRSSPGADRHLIDQLQATARAIQSGDRPADQLLRDA